MNRKYRVGIIGGTGYVGQRFITLLENHPWFEVKSIFASAKSAGRKYGDLMRERWKISEPVPEQVKNFVIEDTSTIKNHVGELDFVFCAVDMPKQALIELEESIAELEIPVISNNSANRWTEDVPMIIPEVNPEHTKLIVAQKKRLGTERGFIAVKPNCSIQSYVPALTPLKSFGIKKIHVCTYQAVSGAGKTLAEWPEINGNIIPYIGGEEAKSEKEPLKVWGKLNDNEDGIELAAEPVISAQCYRVPVQDGHMAAVAVEFEKKPTQEEIIDTWLNYKSKIAEFDLPSAPQPFLQYLTEDDRPQQRLDAMFGRGFGVSIGRLREDPIFDYKFACLSHNTIRGAAGGAILTAELLVKQGFI